MGRAFLLGKMANSKIDDNYRALLTAVSTADGETPVRLEADPNTHALITSGSGGVVTNDGTFAKETGGNLDTLVTSTNNITISQGSTTAGQKGQLIQGAVTTAAPSYTTGQINPLSLDTSGMLRTSLVSTSITSVVPGTGATSLGSATDAARGATKTGVLALVIRKDTATNQVSADGDYAELQIDANGRLHVINSAGVGSSTATGSAAPANAFYIAGINASGNLVGLATIDRLGDAATGSAVQSAGNMVYNGTNYDRARSVGVGDGVASTGLTANGLMTLSPSDSLFYRLRGDNPADATTNNLISLFTIARQSSYNGSTWDRKRNNTTGALIAAGTTTTQTAIALSTYNASKLVLVVNITAGAGSVTVAINGKTASNFSYNILTSTALTGVGTTTLRIFPGATPAANLVANDMVPTNITVTATVSGSCTYGIDWELSV